MLAIYTRIVESTAISFETETPTEEDFRRRLERALERWPWLVAGLDARVLGYAYATSHRDRAAYRWSVDVSVYVEQASQGQGLGRALYAQLLDLLTRQGFVNAYAGIALPNPASVGLHEAMGFEPVGVYRGVGYKLGRWHDVGWWWRRLADPGPGVPAEPLRLPELLHLDVGDR
jgi:phosphinothricin acetyltransferase